jgi:hypothetical protein
MLYIFLLIFKITIFCKQLNFIEMFEKRKCDNNGDSSHKNRAHKTHSFETKLDILKWLLLILSVNTTNKNTWVLLQHVSIF